MHRCCRSMAVAGLLSAIALSGFVASSAPLFAAGDGAPTDTILRAAQTAQAAADAGGLGASQRRVLAAALNQALITEIAGNPGLVEPMVQTAVHAAPDFKLDIVTETTRAFPGFQRRIAAAAANPRPAPASPAPPIVRVATTDASQMSDDESRARAETRAMEQSAPYWIAEVSFGVHGHDVGAFGRKKEDGKDLNAEVRFQPFNWRPWRWILSPMPHLGLHVNTDGKTSQLYFGATWSYDILWGIYGAASLGLSVHDGETDAGDVNQKDLGLPVLFRESLEIGYRVSDHHALSIILDHVSNAGIDENNEGLDTFGIRYTYRL